jgi:hypothetical protein
MLSKEVAGLFLFGGDLSTAQHGIETAKGIRR